MVDDSKQYHNQNILEIANRLETDN